MNSLICFETLTTRGPPDSARGAQAVVMGASSDADRRTEHERGRIEAMMRWCEPTGRRIRPRLGWLRSNVTRHTRLALVIGSWTGHLRRERAEVRIGHSRRRTPRLPSARSARADGEHAHRQPGSRDDRTANRANGDPDARPACA